MTGAIQYNEPFSEEEAQRIVEQFNRDGYVTGVRVFALTVQLPRRGWAFCKRPLTDRMRANRPM